MKTNKFLSFFFFILLIIIYGLILDILLFSKHFICQEYILMFKDIVFMVIKIVGLIVIKTDLKIQSNHINIEKRDIPYIIIIFVCFYICFLLFTLIFQFLNNILTSSICS